MLFNLIFILYWSIGDASGKKILLPTQETQEMWVQPLSWEDPLEKKMATHSSILFWRIPWAEEPQSMWTQSDMTEQLSTHIVDL